ncbi:MAG: hypothetical protein R3C10_15360 [Pirellulales bacterium]
MSLYTAADRQRAAEVEAEAAPLEQARNEKEAKFMEEALTKELENTKSRCSGQLRTAYETPEAERSDEQKPC